MGRRIQPTDADRSGRISLRLTVEVHNELADIALALGIGINALINILIHSGIPEYRQKAAAILGEKAKQLSRRSS